MLDLLFWQTFYTVSLYYVQWWLVFRMQNYQRIQQRKIQNAVDSKLNLADIRKGNSETLPSTFCPSRSKLSNIEKASISDTNSTNKFISNNIFKCQNANMKVYHSLMICVITLHAEDLTPTTITLRYIYCCYMMDELQHIRGIPLVLGKYLFRVWFSNTYKVVPDIRHGTSSGCRWGMTSRCTG